MGHKGLFLAILALFASTSLFAFSNTTVPETSALAPDGPLALEELSAASPPQMTLPAAKPPEVVGEKIDKDGAREL